jgi:hypothetical protein
MTNPESISKYVKPYEKTPDEPDRFPLQAGIRFVITDFILANSKKYGDESIAKINGYDLITRQNLKYRTTAKNVIQQLKDLAKSPGLDTNGKLKSEIKVLVSSYKNENGIGLTLVDPA